MIDIGALQCSTAGYGQFLALQKQETTLQLDISTKGTISVQFGIGTTSSIGSVQVSTPVGNVNFHVVKANTPFLLCLADIDSLRVYYNNLTNVLVTPIGSIPIVQRFSYPFLL